MIPPTPQHDTDATGFGEGGTLVLPGPHRFIGSDQGGATGRSFDDALNQQHIRRFLANEVERVQHLQSLSRTGSLRLSDELDRMSDDGRRILVEDQPHAASDIAGSTPRVKPTACSIPSTSVP